MFHAIMSFVIISIFLDKITELVSLSLCPTHQTSCDNISRFLTKFCRVTRLILHILILLYFSNIFIPQIFLHRALLSMPRNILIIYSKWMYWFNMWKLATGFRNFSNFLPSFQISHESVAAVQNIRIWKWKQTYWQN